MQECKQLKQQAEEQHLAAAAAASAAAKEVLELHGANEQLRAAITRHTAECATLQQDLEAASKALKAKADREAELTTQLAAVSYPCDGVRFSPAFLVYTLACG